MKIKSLMVVFFITCFQAYGMNTSHHLKIEQCSAAQCNKETHNRCNACLLSYYCSKKCQTEDWSNHKKICKAHQSDIGVLRNAFISYFNKAFKTGKHHYIEQAISLHTQTLIRIEQDSACLSDEEIASFDTMLEGRSLLHSLITARICTLQDVQKMLGREVPAAIALVKQRTQDDKLVAPYGIRNFAVDTLNNTEPDPEGFIPKTEWKETRLAMITEYEKKFKSENI